MGHSLQGRNDQDLWTKVTASDVTATFDQNNYNSFFVAEWFGRLTV